MNTPKTKTDQETINELQEKLLQIESATCILESLPELIENLKETYNLCLANYAEDDVYNLVNGRFAICSRLDTIQYCIDKCNDEVERIIKHNTSNAS